jgi:hypothetical protein
MLQLQQQQELVQQKRTAVLAGCSSQRTQLAVGSDMLLLPSAELAAGGSDTVVVTTLYTSTLQLMLTLQ